MPLLVLVAGLNGAGKTTFVRDRLRHFEAFRQLPVVNPDAIAVALQVSPIAAARIALQKRRALLKARQSFAVESDLVGALGSDVGTAGQSGWVRGVAFLRGTCQSAAQSLPHRRTCCRRRPFCAGRGYRPAGTEECG